MKIAVVGATGLVGNKMLNIEKTLMRTFCDSLVLSFNKDNINWKFEN